MLENNDTQKSNELTVKENNSNVLALPVHEAQHQIVKEIIDASDKDTLDRQFALFNLTQSKRNAIRVLKLNDVLDKIDDQMIKRFTTKPDQISNKELMDYENLVSSQIDKSLENVNILTDKPLIKITNQKNEVNFNIGETGLSKESRENAAMAVKELLKQLNKNQLVLTPEQPQEEELITNEQDDSSEIKILNAEEVEINEGENNE